MQQGNLGDHLQLQVLAAAAAVTVTGNGTGIDISSFVGQAAVVLSSAAGTGTAPTLDVKLQESDTLAGTYTDIAGATFTQVGAAAAAGKISINCDSAKAFIRVVDTVTGTGPSFTRAVNLVGVKQNR